MTRQQRPDPGPFAAAVRAARTASGLTQDHAGVHRSTLIRWESGEITEPTLSQLKAFLATITVPPGDILRALGLTDDVPAPATTLADFTDAQLLSELQRRAEDRLAAAGRGRRTG